jgi:hypothetical protein
LTERAGELMNPTFPSPVVPWTTWTTTHQRQRSMSGQIDAVIRATGSIDEGAPRGTLRSGVGAILRTRQTPRPPWVSSSSPRPARCQPNTAVSNRKPEAQPNLCRSIHGGVA